jgi:putative hydrolase of the HAD superfamily
MITLAGPGRAGASGERSPTIGAVTPDTVKAVITDWGGVLTSPLNEAIGVWLTADRIDAERYRTVMRAWVKQAYDAATGTNPIHGLEDGTLPPAEFERLLAAELLTVDGGPVAAEGLIDRMFGAFAPVEPMYAALRAVRASGVRTALLSNSWGNTYPREVFAELFDAVVISAEVGLRKPDERIFRHTLELVGLPPEQCVFIDDVRHNVDAALAVGMKGVHHTSSDATLEELRGLGLRI